MQSTTAKFRIGSVLGIAAGVFALTGSVVAGCGNSETVEIADAAPDVATKGSAACTGDCDCVGTTCTCKQGGNCTLGATAPDGGGPVLPPDNVVFDCQSNNTCNTTCGTGCTTSCEGKSVCQGTCEANCTSTCTGTSECNLSTGVNSAVTCGGGSNCNISIDTGSTLTCTGNSTCAIACPKGGCTAECGGSSGCTVACALPSADAGADGGAAPTACHIKCNGKEAADCPAGTTCNSPCEKQGGGNDGGKPDK